MAQIGVNGRLEPAQRHPRHTMNDLFDFVAGNVEKDRDRARPRSYTRALFNGHDGGLLAGRSPGHGQL